jgi:Rad3-related DNA helicase
MDFDLDSRCARLSVGELADFAAERIGRATHSSGAWRAKVGTQWHEELRKREQATESGALFEVPIRAAVVHRGWKIELTGRIDQVVPAQPPRPVLLREVKTITAALPASAETLRQTYGSYIVQLATYAALRRMEAAEPALAAELVFVEIATGILQTLPLDRTDELLFTQRLEQLTSFLDEQHRSRERLRGLRVHAPFSELRPGQADASRALADALERNRVIAFEAPTGFGKTGILLEAALRRLQQGHQRRLIYLTSKGTGQLQVTQTLARMTAPRVGELPSSSPAVWQVRSKSEHCINAHFACTTEHCGYLQDLTGRWKAGGLSRFYLLDHHSRDLESLRQAGRDASVCPYEITRTALAYNEVWIGDYNYVFGTGTRVLFDEQPGFDPAQTLLVIDEAHNLPSRAAEARSHFVSLEQAQRALSELEHADAPRALVRAWTAWTQLLATLPVTDAADPALEDDVADTVRRVTDQLAAAPLPDLPLDVTEILWAMAELDQWMHDPEITRLVWSPRPGELRLTCLDAAGAIGATLSRYGAVILASATVGEVGDFSTALGLPRVEITAGEPALLKVTAPAPWRSGSFRVGYDLRVDTRFRRRAETTPETARTVARLRAASPTAVAVFFPSYRYAEAVMRELERTHPALRVALQPRSGTLADLQSWIDESLLLADALFLVLGSSFSEGIDVLGGRVTHAMVVGPALPEVNAIQRARLAALSTLPAEAAFRRVYQVPGMQKVNQALGRLVRAPGQHAVILLHCERFADRTFNELLAPEYRGGTALCTDAELDAWLASPPPSLA